MTALPLGPRMLIGTVDETGNNAGNWTVAFTPDVFAINVPFEVYHIIVNGAPGSTFTVFVENNQWDNVQVGDINSWDPSQVLGMRPGQSLYFYYSDAVTDLTPPTVTVWLRAS